MSTQIFCRATDLQLTSCLHEDKKYINDMHINLSPVIILIKKGSKEAANVILRVQYGDLSLCFSHVDIFCKTCR